MIAYIPIVIISTILFIGYNIILIPFAYIKLFFHKLIMIMVYSKSYRVSRADKFMTFVIFIFIGFPVLILNAIVDIGIFVKHLMN